MNGCDPSDSSRDVPRRRPWVDGHVHLVGNGIKGSGCWIRMIGWHRMMAGMMSRTLGLPVRFDHEDFDEICLDVDCSSPVHDRFWETMAAAGLPLLAHTGGEMTVPVANKHYEDPRTLRRPLEIGVKVIAAHAASRSGLFDPDYFDVLIEMMRIFPNLYADTSALNTPVRSAAFKKILRCDLQERFLHGSDFPVPVGTSYTRWRGLIDGEAQKRASRAANLIERDLLLKQAVGFDESHFTRIWDVLRPVGSLDQIPESSNRELRQKPGQ